MKMQLLVLVLGALLPIACFFEQDDDGLFCMRRMNRGEDLHWGEMSALRNDEPWIVSPWFGTLYAFSNDEKETMNIYMGVYDGKWGNSPPPVFPEEVLSFEGIPKRLGTYPLPGRSVEGDTERQSSFLTIDHGAALGWVYEFDKSENGFISIDAYDRALCTIQGTFSISMLREGRPGGVYPYVDTLRFTEGRFHTHVVTRLGAR